MVNKSPFLKKNTYLETDFVIYRELTGINFYFAEKKTECEDGTRRSIASDLCDVLRKKRK